MTNNMHYLQQYQQYLNLKPDGIIGPLTKKAIKKDLDISTDECLAHFMGQCAHESFNFAIGRENTNYSPSRLRKVFRRYFKEYEFIPYGNNPEKIANRVYANRMGNGDELTGDGWKYRGIGAIQLTGKSNIEAYMQYANITSVGKILGSNHYFKSAKWFFDTNNLEQYCKTVDHKAVLKVAKAVNLGSANSKYMPNGIEDRYSRTKEFYT